MLGSIAGDIIGSIYEHYDVKTTDFPLFREESAFTDDTVLTVATAKAILENLPFEHCYKEFARAYPFAGYGAHFILWALSTSSQPYNSWGNGSAMRVSPVGFAFDTIEEVLTQARKSAEVTHNHPEGIKGAQATALSVFLARVGESKETMKKQITERFQYDLNRTLNQIRPTYHFDVSCQGSVPEAIISFLESVDFEDAVRKAVSLGGDSDTIACIAGSIAQAYYKKIPKNVISEVRRRLPEEFLCVIDAFNAEYNLMSI